MRAKHSRRRLTVQGIVQGVGFRPFVFNLACRYGLSGHVSNNAGGVSIEIEGAEEALDTFIQSLREETPPLARIQSLHSETMLPTGESGFSILLSEDSQQRHTLIPPDIATCPDCRKELFDPADRRHRYPFINCTNCGPRFTIIQGIPYDRPMTTMKVFELCERCRREYEDPHNRRFHAQPNACPICGPQLQLVNHCFESIHAADVPEVAARFLMNGEILAIKGMGGFHLACSALDADAVERLRQKKKRNRKPFAIMVDSIETAKRLCVVSPEEEQLMKSFAAPIVLLQKRRDCPIAASVAPNLDELGVMLPYTPLHLLLMDAVKIPLVMTSGNFSEEPIAYREDADRQTLAALADQIVLHNRIIHIRCDDSVARVQRGRERIIRRSRGYTPVPLMLSLTARQPILACGAMLKNTFCLARNQEYLLSHHIGDLENLETLQSFEQGIAHFESLFRCQPEIIISDLHPDYLSTRYAQERSGDHHLTLQHHKAHIASCMADNNYFQPVIGLAWDGLGYGEDGKIWGSEILTGDLSGFARVGHLKEVPQPGGDAATRQPWRMALSHLYSHYGSSWSEALQSKLAEWEHLPVALVESMIAKSVHLPLTTSMGRLFDAVSALVLGVIEITHEAEAAILLEAHARRARELDKAYSFSIIYSGDQFEIDCGSLFEQILSDLHGGIHAHEIAYRFHRGLAETAVRVCREIQAHQGLSTVALSGGVFQNGLLAELTTSLLEAEGFQTLTHSRVPANDGGIALGQAAYAAWQTNYSMDI